ncbi:MAG TPA: FG-GAP-like repeat-containing protein [Pirellulaceae bacterium]|nr:FG-GAP-like repeat-containing protein [Pirellulaceae bacterium]
MSARQRNFSCLLILGVGVLLWWIWVARFADSWRDQPTLSTPAPGDVVAMASTALRLRQVEEAVELIETAKDAPVDTSPALLFDLGTRFVAEGRWRPAEWCLQHAVRLAPEKSEYRLRLATLQYFTGRYSMALTHWLHLLRYGGLDLLSLPMLGNRELRWSQEDVVLDQALKSRVADPLVCLAIAHRAIGVNEFDVCEQVLRTALEVDAELKDTHLRWGELLYEAGRAEEFSAWVVSIQSAPDDGTGWWVLRGHYCRERDELAGAARCYWEAFKRDPNHYVATDLLGRMLQTLGRDAEANRFVVRAGQLREYAAVCRSIHMADDVAEQHLQTAAELSAKLGCSLEAIGWCSVAHVLYPTAEWPVVKVDQVRHERDVYAGRYSPAHDPREIINLTEYPLPAFERDPVAQQRAMTSGAAIRFEDVAERVGIDFIFDDGADPTTPETLIFEFTGGGVAVLDYDLNGWPDLCFVQGGGPPEFGRPAESAVVSEQRPSDRLYANLGTGKFVDVTELAGLTDSAYGQGATVADFNSDGFPDLYVANIGLNCLFANNGDGTFTRQACPTFAEVENWTTSCVIADFNGDGMPDIYDVNHVIREGVRTRMCKSGDASVPCSRQHRLEAAQDRLLLSNGEGGFTDVTDTAGIVAEDGLGLGVIAADFGRTGRLDVFVANDGRANFFFANRGDSPGAELFREQAVVSGLAFNLRGRAQACMGVAADDANGDGLLDLFVTNFFADYNTLYCQLPGSVFEDVTQSAGIQATSYNFLGFGAQFIDADLDGDADLIFTNGDVADYSVVEGPRSYRQRAQFLENEGQGRFREVVPSDLGEFFESERVGRGLARLDWNRDGREDVAISHIGSPAALLSNVSSSAGHYLDVRLVATRSCRDATGAVVTATIKGRRITKQFTAGDGYLASNQKNRIIGLGDATRVAQLQIAWPSGRTETHVDIPVDSTLVFVEECAKPYPISSVR